MFFTKRFTKDLLISIFFLSGLYIVTHNPITAPKPKPKEGNWSIQFMQHPLFLGLAGHNYLVLKDGEGDVIKELHGLATDTATEHWKYIGTNKTDILQVWEFYGSKNYLASKKFPGIILAEGPQEAIETLWTKGSACIPAINEQKIPYPPYGVRVGGDTENSNSVAYTLTLCMGLDTRHIGIFTPGSKKNLLAE